MLLGGAAQAITWQSASYDITLTGAACRAASAQASPAIEAGAVVVPMRRGETRAQLSAMSWIQRAALPQPYMLVNGTTSNTWYTTSAWTTSFTSLFRFSVQEPGDATAQAARQAIVSQYFGNYYASAVNADGWLPVGGIKVFTSPFSFQTYGLTDLWNGGSGVNYGGVFRLNDNAYGSAPDSVSAGTSSTTEFSFLPRAATAAGAYGTTLQAVYKQVNSTVYSDQLHFTQLLTEPPAMSLPSGLSNGATVAFDAATDSLAALMPSVTDGGYGVAADGSCLVPVGANAPSSRVVAQLEAPGGAVYPASSIGTLPSGNYVLRFSYQGLDYPVQQSADQPLTQASAWLNLTLTAAPAVAVPTLGPLGLALMALLCAAAMAWAGRARRA